MPAIPVLCSNGREESLTSMEKLNVLLGRSYRSQQDVVVHSICNAQESARGCIRGMITGAISKRGSGSQRSIQQPVQ